MIFFDFIFSVFNLILELPEEQKEMNVGEVVLNLNKLYKKKFKYIQQLDNDEEKLEIYRQLKGLELIM